MMAPVITGTLALPLAGRLDVRIALEDITAQDRRATTVAETHLTDVEGQVPFTLQVADIRIDPKRDYTLAARAYRRGESAPVAGTVAVHPWRQGEERPQDLSLYAFWSGKGEQR